MFLINYINICQLKKHLTRDLSRVRLSDLSEISEGIYRRCLNVMEASIIYNVFQIDSKLAFNTFCVMFVKYTS